MTIDFSKTKPGDKLRIVGAGARARKTSPHAFEPPHKIGAGMEWETTMGGPMVGENVLGYCNRMGKQGWEPFHIEPPQVYEGGRATVYFKRPVK